MPQATKLFTRLINWAASKWANEITWSFDTDEAQGDVELTRGGYGVYVSFPEIMPGNYAAILADLFYRTENGAGIHKDQPWAIQVYGQSDLGGDPIQTELYYRLKWNQDDE